MAKNLILVIVGHQGYIRHIEDGADYASENELLFDSISNTYLPLINLFYRLEAESVPFKVSLVLSPMLCALFDDPMVQQQYIEWLDDRIALGEKEIIRCKDDDSLCDNARSILAQYKKDKADFCDKYEQNLLKQFAEIAKNEHLELIATAASYAYLPHYADMPEVLNAQVEAGLYSHRRYFGAAPEGFWLPYLGYADDVEKVIRSYGINYTILDTRSILFSKDSPADGIFSPVRCYNSLVVFGRDKDTPADIVAEETGFMHNPLYKNLYKDIGFELDADALGNCSASGKARVATGYRYWSKQDTVYDKKAALAQAEKDAKTFLDAKKTKLDAAEGLLNGNDASLVCAFDAAMLGQDWAEGMYFLEQVIRGSEGMTLSCGADLIQNQFSLPKIKPYPSAASGTGYGEDLLDSSNGWMLRHTRKMCERMIDLAGRFPDDTGLKVRLLNLGAKELMIAQCGDWAKMLHEGRYPEYVTERFKQCIASFIAVFDSLGSNTVSTEWLTKIEREHPLFPWMNYRIFSKKK
ncbi:MAG: DUF1957 domain-containing protein [Treponema sp.]|nr:DUF1957 domain-containing protein [Treponema sp.]